MSDSKIQNLKKGGKCKGNGNPKVLPTPQGAAGPGPCMRHHPVPPPSPQVLRDSDVGPWRQVFLCMLPFHQTIHVLSARLARLSSLVFFSLFATLRCGPLSWGYRLPRFGVAPTATTVDTRAHLQPLLHSSFPRPACSPCSTSYTYLRTPKTPNHTSPPRGMHVVVVGRAQAPPTLGTPPPTSSSRPPPNCPLQPPPPPPPQVLTDS